MAFSWSDYQQAVFNFIDQQKRNLIINSVAGSGKSTTILEVARRILGSVGIVAFNKSIADELRGKIAVMKKANPRMRVDAKTFHAAGLWGLKQVAGDKEINVDDNKIRKIVQEVVFGPPGKPEEGRADLADFVSFIEAAVKMAKNLAFGVEGGNQMGDKAAWLWMTYHYTLDDKLPENIEDRLEDKAIPACIAILKKSNRDLINIDFSDMCYLPLVHDLKVWQYDTLLVDEVQDLNLTRILLAKKMVRRGGRFVFVGDPRQCIYGFTGALHDAMDQIQRDFNCSSLPLSVCYRSARLIVEYAQQIVSHILPAPGAVDGEVLFWGGDEFDAAAMLPTDAILCRVNAPLVTLAFSLIRRGIACKIEGREIGAGLVALVNRWKVKSLSALRNRLESYREREVAKATAKDDAERADAIADKVNTLIVLIERAEALKLDVEGLKAMILDMFSDDVTKQGILTLCSYHKSKGREWLRVFRLDHLDHCPSKFAKLPHQKVAEENLDYVARTRAMHTLVEVNTSEETLKKVVAEEREKVAA